MTNREIARSNIQKADMKVSDMTTNGGVLLPAQSREFLEISIQDQRLLKDVFYKPLSAPVQEIDKVGFLSRITRGSVEGQSLSLADRAAPTTGKVTLTTVQMKCQVNLTEVDIEDNIEGDALPTHVKKLMGERFGLDLEDLSINGDTTSSDPLLMLLNGILKQSSTNVVDDGSIVLAQAHFLHLANVLPSQFQKDKSRMRFYVAPTIETKWRDLVSPRYTNLGDNALTSASPIPAYGVQVVPVPMFPTNLGGGTNESNIIFCDPKNICVGVWKDVTFKTQEDIQAGVLMVVCRARVAVSYLHEPAVAKAVKVKSA